MQAATAQIATLRVSKGTIVLQALGEEAGARAGARAGHMAAGLGGSSRGAERQRVAAVAEVT